MQQRIEDAAAALIARAPEPIPPELVRASFAAAVLGYVAAEEQCT